VDHQRNQKRLVVLTYRLSEHAMPGEESSLWPWGDPRQLKAAPEGRKAARGYVAEIRSNEKRRIRCAASLGERPGRMSRADAPDHGLAARAVLEYSWRPGPLRIEPSVQIRSPQIIGDRRRERPELVRTDATL
jgi:hypothetical protein